MTEDTEPILIYDDNCHLCRKSVKFLSGKETAGRFQFIPSDNKITATLLQQHNLNPGITEKTVILIHQNRVYTKSSAIIKAMQMKGKLWRLAALLYVVPAFFRNWIYDLIASSRKK